MPSGISFGSPCNASSAALWLSNNLAVSVAVLVGSGALEVMLLADEVGDDDVRWPW